MNIFAVLQIPQFVDITDIAIVGEKPIGSFVAIRDYDGDGLEDILIDKRLYKNISYHNTYFYEVTEEAGLEGAKGHGTFVDLNGDLCPDIIFYGIDYDMQIYKNDCNGGFIKIENLSALENCKYTDAITYLYYKDFRYPLIYCATYEKDGEYFKDYLYATDGDFFFFDVSYLIHSEWFRTETPSRCAISGDINNDGLIDIYVCNYRLFSNFMFISQSSGIFTNEAINLNTSSGKSNGGDIKVGSHTIGATLSDINNDGQFEILLANLAHNDYERGFYNLKSQILFYDKKKNKFVDIREAGGIKIDDVGSNINGIYKDELFSNVSVADFNNDGIKDILFTQVYDKSYSYGRFFTSISDRPYFVDSTFISIPLFYDSLGTAISDFNRDGCLDIVVAGKKFGETNRHIILLQNICNYTGDYIGFKLFRNYSNAGVEGSKIRIYITKLGESKILLGQVESTASGFGQQNADIVHFGLGNNYKIDRVEIEWNSGLFQILYNFNLNKINYIVEPELKCRITNIESINNRYYVFSNCRRGEYFLFIGNSCSNELREIDSDNFTSDFSAFENFCRDFLIIVDSGGVGKKYIFDEYNLK